MEFINILKLKRYSKQTINNDKGHLLFSKPHFNSKRSKSISDQELFGFIYHLVNIKGIAASYQRQIIRALHLLYREIHRRDIPFEYLKVNQRENKLPGLSKSKPYS